MKKDITDNLPIVDAIARHSGVTHDKVTAMLSCFVEEVEAVASSLDSVAIPGFGTFEGVKHDETIEVAADGNGRMLLPPSVRLEFRPSVVLRKKLKS